MIELQIQTRCGAVIFVTQLLCRYIDEIERDRLSSASGLIDGNATIDGSSDSLDNAEAARLVATCTGRRAFSSLARLPKITPFLSNNSSTAPGLNGVSVHSHWRD